MNTNRKTAIIVGVLFITATVATLISQVILSPILDTPGFLVNVAANRNQLILGVLLELVNAFASAGIAIAIFPVLKNYSEGIAIGYVSFRAIEAAIGVVASINLLSLLTLSQAHIIAGKPITLDVENREYHPWETQRVVVDTANKEINESFEELNTITRSLIF